MGGWVGGWVGGPWPPALESGLITDCRRVVLILLPFRTPSCVVSEPATNRIAGLAGIEGVEEHAGTPFQVLADRRPVGVAGSGVETKDGYLRAEMILLVK